MKLEPMLPIRLIALGALAVVALLVTGAPSLQAAPTLQQQVEAARTLADHEALAQRYDQEAAAARARAADHRLLGKSYQSGSQYPQSPYVDRVGPAGSMATGMPPMPRHCEALARAADETAQAYSELAAEHRRLAQQLKDKTRK